MVVMKFLPLVGVLVFACSLIVTLSRDGVRDQTVENFLCYKKKHHVFMWKWKFSGKLRDCCYGRNWPSSGLSANRSRFLRLILQLAGDVEENPGPPKPAGSSYPSTCCWRFSCTNWYSTWLYCGWWLDDFLPLDADYIPDASISSMSSQDTQIVNTNGLNLLDFCKSSGLRIPNGRVDQSLSDSFTCFISNGNSVVDYVILKEEFFS